MQKQRRRTRRAALGALAAGSLLAGMAACEPFPGSPPTGISVLGVKVVGFTGVGAAIATPTRSPFPYPTPTPDTYPFPGWALVRVTPAGSPRQVIAEQQAYDSHWLDFHLPEGTYWVFCPLDHQSTLAGGSWTTTNTPDRATQVYAGAEVSVPRAASVDVLLIVNYLTS